MLMVLLPKLVNYRHYLYFAAISSHWLIQSFFLCESDFREPQGWFLPVVCEDLVPCWRYLTLTRLCGIVDIVLFGVPRSCVSTCVVICVARPHSAVFVRNAKQITECNTCDVNVPVSVTTQHSDSGTMSIRIWGWINEVLSFTLGGWRISLVQDEGITTRAFRVKARVTIRALRAHTATFAVAPTFWIRHLLPIDITFFTWRLRKTWSRLLWCILMLP